MQINHTINRDTRDRVKSLLPKECNYIMKDETLEKLFDLSQKLVLEKEEILIHAGEQDPNFYICYEGIMRCWYWNKDKEETTYFSTEPTCFIDYHSYLGNEGSFYNYEAITECKLLRVKKSDYDYLLRISHDFTMFNLVMSQTQYYYLEKYTRQNVGSAKQRYESLIKEIPQIAKKVPLQVIASYLHITPQYLSKLRGKN